MSSLKAEPIQNSQVQASLKFKPQALAVKKVNHKLSRLQTSIKSSLVVQI